MSLWNSTPGVPTTCDGETQVTLTPFWYTSAARPWVKRSSAAFSAPYRVPPRSGAVLYGPRPGPIAAPLEMFTIAPDLRAIISSSTSRLMKNGPCTFTANDFSHLAGGNSAIGMK